MQYCLYILYLTAFSVNDCDSKVIIFKNLHFSIWKMCFSFESNVNKYIGFFKTCFGTGEGEKK